MAETKQNLQDSATIAKLFGVTERRVQQLAKEKVIPAAKQRPYMFDLLPTLGEARTIRPALVREGKLLRRGTAACRMERSVGM